MEHKPPMKLVETDTATVKMTVGTPFTAGEGSSSSSEESDGEQSAELRDSRSPKWTSHNTQNNKTSTSVKASNSNSEYENSSDKSNRNVKCNPQDSSKTTSSKLNTKSSASDIDKNLVIKSGSDGSRLASQQTALPKDIVVHDSGRNEGDCGSERKGNSSKDASSASRETSAESITSDGNLSFSQSHHQQNQETTGKSSQKNSPPSPERVNPFNKALLVEEDHFSDTENFFRHGQSIDSYSSSSLSQGFDWQNNPEDSSVTFAELGLSEDHFSHPQGHFGLSGAEELELAIENCKELIRDAVPDSEKQKNLVLKLVQLRIKLQEIKEGTEPVPENTKVILSHKMLLRTSKTSKYYCEKCNGGIWGMLQVWYKCTECGYRCHERCLHQILRTCAKAKVLQNPVLCLDICPVDPAGLAGQGYRCAECRAAISFSGTTSEPRLCDYSGQYYCELCHWNDTYKIPARIVHNWDFTSYKVCRASKQFLRLMHKKAVIRIQDVNPMLFGYVDQLNEIKKLREEMMIMKKYILSCISAMKAKLLLMLEARQHFVENSDIYSMQDLLDTEEVLLPELVKVHSTWAQHIKVDCELCQGRGFCCELCHDREVLFPFDNTAVVCPTCSSVLHRHCFAKKGICPRCERRHKRKLNKA
ncbi:hypothetical protein EGW08_013679 [Elysia chlorotica]|uniref:Phorbol-ester/DAG-type domain-containing protein n=1 Tax=Elysia chlorotica TaxID=188477 RepID=A0A3S1B9V0_ELYCH|nr:hypothetical protein EGW08_013679 [Elysia chlorotica]